MQPDTSVQVVGQSIRISPIGEGRQADFWQTEAAKSLCCFVGDDTGYMLSKAGRAVIRKADAVGAQELQAVLSAENEGLAIPAEGPMPALAMFECRSS